MNGRYNPGVQWFWTQVTHVTQLISEVYRERV
jgi:hypothetical protein